MKRIALIAMLALTVAGCSKNAERTEIRGAGGFEVQTLFTHEGCTVYRFYDDRTVYFVKCENGSARTSEEHMEGKVTVQNSVSTETVE